MSSAYAPAETIFPARPIRKVASKVEAARLLVQLAEAMDNLVLSVELEAELIRAERLDDLGALKESQATLAEVYLVACERLKANGAFLAQHLPREARAMRRRHDIFNALFRVNLAILAASRAAAESVARQQAYAACASFDAM